MILPVSVYGMSQANHVIVGKWSLINLIYNKSLLIG